MKELIVKQTIHFTPNNSHDAIMIAPALSVNDLMIWVDFEKPSPQITDLIFWFTSFNNKVKKKELPRKFDKGSKGGKFILSRSNEKKEFDVSIIEVQSNVSDTIKVDISVFKIDEEEKKENF